ncbi:MAG: hypothetical protein ACKJSG_13235 [Lentisphaeria bacterium]
MTTPTTDAHDDDNAVVPPNDCNEPPDAKVVPPDNDIGDIDIFDLSFY